MDSAELTLRAAIEAHGERGARPDCGSMLARVWESDEMPRDTTSLLYILGFVLDAVNNQESAEPMRERNG